MGYEIVKAKSGCAPIVIDDTDSIEDAHTMLKLYRKKYPGLAIYIQNESMRGNPPAKIPVVIERTMEEVPPWPV